MDNFISFIKWVSPFLSIIISVSFLQWVLLPIFARIRLWTDSRKVYSWLVGNTKDSPCDSHKSLFEIGNGTRLFEERVRFACLQNRKIYRSLSTPDLYSIWRHEPQSIYATRGLI